MVKYEHRYREYHEAVRDMPRLPAYTITGKKILHMLLTKPREIFVADIFSTDDETLLCIVDYYSTFSAMWKTDGLSADDLIRATQVMFAEFGLPKNSIT